MHARYIIHTVGPVWHGGTSGEPELLRSCYLQSIALAQSNGVESIAFPCISTGIYGYPSVLAAQVAVAAVRQALSDGRGKVSEVLFCCYSGKDLEISDFSEAASEVDVVGDVAVVNYRYEPGYERSGQRYRSTRRDLYVLRAAGDAWVVVWRTILDVDERMV